MIAKAQLDVILEFLNTMQKHDPFEKFFHDDALFWTTSSNGQELLLRLLNSPHKRGFELASYVLSESGPSTQEFMDRVVNTIRVSENDGCMLFVSILFHHRSFWRQSYADLLLRCLNHGFTLVRERAILVLSDDSCSALEDTKGFLLSYKDLDYLGGDLVSAYSASLTMDAIFDEEDEADKDGNTDIFLKFLDIKRAIRGLYIADSIKRSKFAYLRETSIEEDSSVLDSLELSLGP